MKTAPKDGVKPGQATVGAMKRSIRCQYAQRVCKASDYGATGAGKRSPELWMSSYIKTIRLSCLVSTKDPVEAAAKVRFAVEEGYRGVDLKIGPDLQKDFDILAAVRQNALNLYL